MQEGGARTSNPIDRADLLSLGIDFSANLGREEGYSRNNCDNTGLSAEGVCLSLVLRVKSRLDFSRWLRAQVHRTSMSILQRPQHYKRPNIVRGLSRKEPSADKATNPGEQGTVSKGSCRKLLHYRR